MPEQLLKHNCTNCGSLLWIGQIGPGSVVQIHCRKCKRIVEFRNDLIDKAYLPEDYINVEREFDYLTDQEINEIIETAVPELFTGSVV